MSKIVVQIQLIVHSIESIRLDKLKLLSAIITFQSQAMLKNNTRRTYPQILMLTPAMKLQ